MKTKELLLIANEKSAIRTADYIPQRFYACPEFQLTLEDRNTDISSFISTYKCEEEKLLALKRCALRGTQHLFSCLINPKLSLSLKAKLIEFINQPAVNPFPPMPNIVHYAEKINPDTFSIINPFIKDLLFHLYQAKDYAPLGLQEGRTLDAFVQSHLPCTYQEKIPAQFSDCQEVNVAGGRTLRISNAQDGATYYKFQRQDESLDELSREGLMHQYLSDTSLRNELKSQLPVFKQFIKVPLEHLPEAVNTFADALEITEAEGKKFVNVYCFEASEHYSTYAHVREPEAAKPCEKAEIGIKMACYDCGVLAAKGIFLTSTLPAFHNGSTRWSCLRGAIVSDLSSPGKFESWNTTATERPDFGWDGVRDLGDYEVFDQLNDYLVELSAIRSVHHPETMKQRLALANIICEYMIAATLLRARLQQTSPDYHYKNADAIEKTKQFTEATMDAFLSGYYSTESSDIRPNLQEMLQLNPPNYHAWLERTAKEILYWTATQSLSGSTETPVTGRHEMTDDPRQSVPDDYGQHLKEGFLSPELYPDLHKTFKRFPRDVTPENKTVDPGALHLGFFNSLFPLQALISGLTKMCSGIFSHSSAMSGHEVKKQAWFKNTGF